MGRLDQAAARYREALRLDPALVDAHTNLGTILRAQGDLMGAVRVYETAIRHAPEDAPSLPNTYNNMAVALADLGMFNDAINAYIAALHHNNELWDAYCGLAHTRSRVCDWRDRKVVFDVLEQVRARLRHGIANQLSFVSCEWSLEHTPPLTPPFLPFCEQTNTSAHDPAHWQVVAQNFALSQVSCVQPLHALSYPFNMSLLSMMAQSKAQAVEREVAWIDRTFDHGPARAEWAAVFAAATNGNDDGDGDDSASARPQVGYPPLGRRIKIGYVSSDFRGHPISYLLGDALGLHDSNAVETWAFATTPPRDGTDLDADKWRRKIRANVDHFVDLGGMQVRVAECALPSHSVDRGEGVFVCLDGLAIPPGLLLL